MRTELGVRRKSLASTEPSAFSAPGSEGRKGYGTLPPCTYRPLSFGQQSPRVTTVFGLCFLALSCATAAEEAPSGVDAVAGAGGMVTTGGTSSGGVFSGTGGLSTGGTSTTGGSASGGSASGGVASGGASTGGTSTGGAATGGGATGGSATGGTSTGGSVGTCSGDFTVTFKDQRNNNTDYPHVLIELKNNGSPVALNQLALRYYLDTSPVTGSWTVNISQQELVGPTAGVSGTTGSFVDVGGMPNGQNGYYELKTSAGGNLATGQTFVVKFYAQPANYSGSDQTDDWSYAGLGATAPTCKIPVYVNGTLVYGTEP